MGLTIPEITDKVSQVLPEGISEASVRARTDTLVTHNFLSRGEIAKTKLGYRRPGRGSVAEINKRCGRDRKNITRHR